MSDVVADTAAAAAAALDTEPAGCYVEFTDSSSISSTTHTKRTDIDAKIAALGINSNSTSPSKAHSLWTRETIAIPITYIYTGLLVSLPAAYIEYFPRVLGASDAQLSTIAVVRNLPWTFKVVFGILPDAAPVCGQRFKPYLLLGCAISSSFHLLLSAHSDDALTVVTFTLLLLGAMVGIVMADVMSDALVANRVLRQLETASGHTQSVVYTCRFVSEMTGFWLGALVSNRSAWGVGLSMQTLFLVLALAPLVTVVPFVLWLDEPYVVVVQPLRVQLQQLHSMLASRATWQPLSFLALFNACLVHNAAWGNYLKVAFAFDAFEYGALAAVGATVTLAAIVVYRFGILGRYDAAWQALYVVTGAVVAIVSSLNVLLVLGVNKLLGIAPFWFAVGDMAVVAFARGFQYLPLALIFVSVCPHGQEGVAFALLTSMTNVAHAVANTVSNMLLALWPVEFPDLVAGHVDGVWKLSVLTAAISLVPLLFVTTLMPRGRADLERLRDDTSAVAARVVIVTFAVGVVWVTVLSLLAVAQPCSVLVGGSGCD